MARQWALAIAASVAMLLGVAGVAIAARIASDPAPTHTGRACFPAAQWNGGTVPDRYRPCARILRVYEDGSLRIRVTDADGTHRYGMGVGVPNGYERGRP